MENISKLLGKPVISIYDGNLEGYVKNVLIDKKLEKLCWLEIFDDESQEEKIVCLKNIYTLQSDAVMIKNSEQVYVLNTIDTKCINPIGFRVYELDGTYFSSITDLEYDEKLNVTNILLQDNKTLNICDVLNVGNGLVIKKNNNTKLYNFKPKAKIETKVTINQVVKMQTQTKKQIKVKPKKLLTPNYDFLIGRKVGKNIYTENKQILIKKDIKIDNKIIRIASNNGKLKELTSYSI